MRIRYLCVFALFSTVTLGQNVPVNQKTKADPIEPESKTAAPLPVEKVILYKNGVGYFEHIGRVSGNQDLGIDFTTSQLNDVLKSLTLVDLSGGRISDVRYNSVAPLDQQLKSLQIPLGEDVTSASFLTALRGTRVEVRSGKAAATGKLFSVETIEKQNAKGEKQQITQLAVVTDAGELRLFELSPDVTVRAAENEIHKDVNRYLDLLGTTRSKDLRRMTIHASGTGERRIFVSYISEVPVWKSTYRIVIPAAPAKPFLQGWAIIDNTVGEDWKNVKLTLVSGTPQSFIQNISQPYYTRRPVVAVPQSMMLTPQAHEATMEEYAKLQSPASGQGGGAGGGSGEGIAGGGMGATLGRINSVTGNAALGAAAETVEVEAINTALGKQPSEAEGNLVGDLFEYGLKERITVLKNQSALVPIVQSPLDVEKVTLITADENNEELGTPLRALWMRNTSGQTLDGGTFNILEEDSFAGEGIMELLHPNERRLLSYAADQAVHVKKEDGDDKKITTRVTILKGVMAIHQEHRDTTTYTVRNADTLSRQVILEHPIREGWELGQDIKPEESGATHYRFRLPVEPGKSEKLVIRENLSGVTKVFLSTLTDEQITAFLQEGEIQPSTAQALRKITAKKFEISSVDQEIKARQQELEAIDRDQSRLRENMKALKGSPEEKALLQRYTKQLDAQEDRVATLQNEIATLKTQRLRLNSELETMVQQLTLDETI
jgi:hypothetical protein